MKAAAHHSLMLDIVNKHLRSNMSQYHKTVRATFDKRIPVRKLRTTKRSGYALSVSPHGPGRLVLLILLPAIHIHINLGTKLISAPAK